MTSLLLYVFLYYYICALSEKVLTEAVPFQNAHFVPDLPLKCAHSDTIEMCE